MTRPLAPPFALAVVLVTLSCWAPSAAVASNPVKPICTLAGLVSPLAGKVCSAAGHAGRLLTAGKKLLGGHLGGAAGALLNSVPAPVVKGAAAAAGIAAIDAWVNGGAKFALRETAAVVSSTTRPQLQSTWFSAAYWRMAGVSALLTLPFLFAAALQALVRSDPALLARAALGYLPLGLLAVGVAAPVTMLLLAASDEMAAIVTAASGGANGSFLAQTGAFAGGLGLVARNAFPVFLIGLVTVAATATLWIELLIRSAAVYVIVLMLPLFFAALVWPARRIWTIRALELLVALILSKFAIVAVLALGGTALGHLTGPSLTQMLAGTTLVLLAAFTPWALLRLLPLHELASGAAAGLSGTPGQRLLSATAAAGATATGAAYDAVHELPARLGRQADPDTGAELETSHATDPAADPGYAFGSADPRLGSAGAGASAPSPNADGGEPRAVLGPETPGWPAGPDPGQPPAAGPDASASAGETAQTSEAPVSNRIRGMDAQWQRPNLSWPEFDLEDSAPNRASELHELGPTPPEAHDHRPAPPAPEDGPL